MKKFHFHFQKLFLIIGIGVPVWLWAAEGTGTLRNEEPSDTEIRRLQTQLNILDTRITDPTNIEQKRVLQDQLFQKIRRMHDNVRQEKDLVGEITAKKNSKSEEAMDSGSETKNSSSSKISASARAEETSSPVAPLKLSPPVPPTESQSTPPPVRRPTSDDQTMEIYRSIINYSSNSAPRAVGK
jgi:hypothetical protein